MPYDADGAARFGGDRLIWLYDVHLLIGRMSAADLDEFTALACAKKLQAICGETLQRAHECSRGGSESCHRPVDRAWNDRSVRSLPLGGGARQMVGDFLAFERWSDRRGWVREFALPSADYMHTKYPDAAITWLPILYARRTFTGLAHLIFSRPKGR
jgi:hypothetical protein